MASWVSVTRWRFLNVFGAGLQCSVKPEVLRKLTNLLAFFLCFPYFFCYRQLGMI